MDWMTWLSGLMTPNAPIPGLSQPRPVDMPQPPGLPSFSFLGGPSGLGNVTADEMQRGAPPAPGPQPEPMGPIAPPPMMPAQAPIPYQSLGQNLMPSSMPPNVTAGSVGGNVANAPFAPQQRFEELTGRESGAPGPAAQAMNRAAPQSAVQQGLAGAMRGVQAMKPPEAQTVRTPPPPQMAPIRGGDLVSMMMSLGIGPAEFQRMMGLRLGGR